MASGVDASKSLRRTSSLIKARVTRELPGLPSLQPMHHVLSGAESILAKIMRLSSKVGTVIPEEAGEAAAQSGASSAAVSAAQSGGQAADAANAQVRRDAPQQQAQQPAISEQQAQQSANHEQQAQQPAFPQQQAQQPAIPEQQAQQLANPEQQQAQHGPQQAQHVPYYGPRQPPAYVPAAAVPAPVVQQVPVMAPAPMPVITARVTNVQVWLNPWSRVGDIL